MLKTGACGGDVPRAPTIAPMSIPRRLRLLVSWMLAWFALSLGAAMASPFVQPPALQWVCSGAGEVKLVAAGDEAATERGGHALDCPLCLPLGTAPPAATALLRAPSPAAQLALAARHHPPTARSAAPLPARGPPHPHFPL